MNKFERDILQVIRSHGFRRLPDLYNSQYLKGLPLDVKTIIDVGVRKGTPALYEAFPECHFLLVDPQKGGESLLESRPGSYEFINVALGACPGTQTFKEQGAMSTFLDRTSLTHTQTYEEYEVSISTLDQIIKNANPKARFGIKIDTEGYEIEVVKGLDDFAREVEFIICEASIRSRFVGGYRFGDLVRVLGDKGFQLYNFLNAPSERPRFYDVIFLPEDHSLFK